jgi:hypothetical protein
MSQKKIKKILLFSNSDSHYYATTLENFKALVNSLGKIGKKFDVEVIDVRKNPEMAEQYNILVEPTLVIGDQYFIGRFKEAQVAQYMQQYFAKNKSLKR